MPFNRPDTDPELLTYLTVRVPLDDQSEDIDFARCKRLDRFGPGTCRLGLLLDEIPQHGGVNVHIPAHHNLDGGDQLGFRSLFQDVARRAGVNGFSQQRIVLVDSKDAGA